MAYDVSDQDLVVRGEMAGIRQGAATATAIHQRIGSQTTTARPQGVIIGATIDVLVAGPAA